MNSGQDVFDIQGASYIVIENITVTGGFNGIEIANKSDNIELLNDTITENSDVGVLVDANTTGTATAVTGLQLEYDTISDNGLDGNGNYYGGNQDGVLIEEGNGGVLFLDNQVFSNDSAGIDVAGGSVGNGSPTIIGGAVYDQTGLYGDAGNGIVDNVGGVIQNVEAYANHEDGIYISYNSGYTNTAPGTVSGNTVFGNLQADIEAHAATIIDNVIYSDLNTGQYALELDNASTGTGNTLFGSANGIYLDEASDANGNLVYDIKDAGISYGDYAPAGITDNTVYGTGIGIAGAQYYNGNIIPIDGNLIYQNVTAAIWLDGPQGGIYQSIVNNTIDEQSAIGIYVGGESTDTTIENNIIVDVSGPAIDVAHTAEGGFFSDYNFFDVGGQSTLSGSTIGTIGIWEGVSYTSLANWYYEIGVDQHSQVGNPDFVLPLGATGVQGFGSPSGQASFYSSGYAFNVPEFDTPVGAPVQQMTSLGAVPGGTVDLTGTWTPVNDTAYGSFASPKPGTVVTTSGTTTTTVTTTVYYTFETNGFGNNGSFTYEAPLSALPLLYYTTTGAITGPGATATWTFTGLTPGETYQLNAINEALGDLGEAQYVVTDGNGTVLTAGDVDQSTQEASDGGVASFTNSGTITQFGSIVTVSQSGTHTTTGTSYFDTQSPYTVSFSENEVGAFIATGSTAVVTMQAYPGDLIAADTMLLEPVGFNTGASDDFHLQPGSPAIDAGDPTTPFLAEPAPNGGRVNQGYDGDTSQAQVSSSSSSVQVLSPAGLSKYQIGEQVPINFETTGLTSEQPVLLLHAGGSSIATGLDGNWSADAFRTTGQSVTDTQSAANIGTLAGVPTALFSSGAALANGATTGQDLTFQLPVQNGSYTMTLYFAEPSANASGQREFNIIANGQTLQTDFDIYATAEAKDGDAYHAVSLTFNVTVTGGQGLTLDFAALGTDYGPLVNGIELEQADPNGTASPTATVQLSTDDGAAWTTLATGVPINSYGEGQYVWTVNQTSDGNTALIQVLATANPNSAQPITVSGTSQPFLLANSGNSYYVNDASLAGDQYTTAVGNDANSGKSPDQPLLSLAALLRAYPIGPGDTIYVDAGNYTLPTNVTLAAADSGTASQPLVITGPSIGSAAVLDRNNTASGTDVFDLIGVNNIVIENLTIEGAYDAVDIGNGATSVVLSDDVIANNLNAGVDVPYGADVSGLVVKNSIIDNDGSLVYGYGIYFGYDNSNALFLNDQVFSIFGDGILLDGAGNQTVQGGSYYDNNGSGVVNNSTALIEDVVAFGNSGNGADGISSNGGTTTGNTVFGNNTLGISAEGVISDNLVYSQRTTGQEAIAVGGNSTATGNTVYGSTNGLFLNGGADALDNLVYDVSGTAIFYTLSLPNAISGNTLYGDGIGVTGAEYYVGATLTISGNLIYENATAGIELSGGVYQQIINNTIDQPTGTAIAITAVNGGDNATADDNTIENNILAVAAGPAITIAPSAEAGLVSDYNLFDLSGTGSIASWESVSYTSLAAWYYATGLDQHSQVANPDFVNPAGADGILGYQALTGTASVVTASSPNGFSVSGTWTAYTGGSGGAGATALQTAAGSGGSATWTFNGLTPGIVYEVAANWPSNFIAGNARFTVLDANGSPLAADFVSQYNEASTGIVADGVGFTLLGYFTATTTSLTVTLTGDATDLAIADGVLVQAVGVNGGADDDFHLQPGSPAIDAGNPSRPFILEPSPTGGRVNQGYDGDTAQAQTSAAAQTLQVLNPAQFAKYEVGEQVPITINASDAGQTQAVLTLSAGNTTVDSSDQGNWQPGVGDITSGGTFTNAASVTNQTGIPTALFATGASASNTSTPLSFEVPIANGTYTLRLFFADPQASADGQRVFDVIVNGQTLAANYDVFKNAGGEDKAVELDLTVTATGGTGISLQLAYASGYYAPFVNAIELDQTVAGLPVDPTANISVSTDGGETWSLIATNVPVNRYGEAEYNWTVDRTSTGANAMIQVTSGTITATSQPFLLANGGTLFYVDDSSLTGNQYTTAVGNDANSGKSPDQPMASLAALLRAYPIVAGDTVFVDTGNYVATSDAVLPAGDGGTAADPAVIIGPTNGGTVVINRNNTSAGFGVIDDTGAAAFTIENLQLTGASDGVRVSGNASNLTLLNDSIYSNDGSGIFTSDNAGTITGLSIADSSIYNNIGPGITLQQGVLSAVLSNDQVYNNSADGIDANAYGGTVTINGGAVDDNTNVGIDANYSFTIEAVQVHGNGRDGIDASENGTRPLVANNTVYANAENGIYADSANVIDNLVFDQVNTSYVGIETAGLGTATGNTVYGSSTGLYASGGYLLLDNVLYENSRDGLQLANSGNTVIGDSIYGNQIGVASNVSSVALENDLIYNNVSIGIALSGGSGITLINNTVYQPIGQALTIASTSSVTVENNILWVNEGTIISVAVGATTGFVSEYNLFYQGADEQQATLGSWQGTIATNLANWQSASAQDMLGSKTGDPDFVNMNGADQILGGPGTLVGTGLDDDFELQGGSPAIDSANAYVAPFTDALGQPRSDDPATPNTGIGYADYVQTSGGASSLPSTTGLTNKLSSNGGVTSYTLPFAFSLYNVTYTTVTISSQGYLQFAGPNYDGYDTPSVSGLAANARIAPFWANFNTDGTGDGVFVSTGTVAGTAYVTFEWVGTSNNTGGGTVDFAVTLYQTGSIVFNYGSIAANLVPVIGIAAGNGTILGQTPIDVLSTANGSAAMNNAAAEVFTPQPGDTYFDMGAYEFQGNSNDKTPPTVISINLQPANTPLPANDGTTGLAFTSVTVTFSEPLDLVSANSPANYSLIEADSNGNFNTTGSTPIPVTPVYTLGSTTVTLELPDGPLAPGLYQLTLSGTHAIFDQSGNALAGNGTTAGTDYVTVFSVSHTADVAPIANAQTVSVAEDGSIAVVLSATDTQGNPLTYSIVTPPADGTLTAITNGNTLTYSPAAGFFGTDSFIFQATDPDGEESQATVTVGVTPVDQRPVATAETLNVIHDAPQIIVLSGTDAQIPASELIYTIVTEPTHGTLTQVSGSPNSFTYTPNSGYLGTDSFSFTVTDTGNPPGNLSNAMTSAPATVSLDVTDPAPVGVPDSYTTREGVPLTVAAAQGVLANDTDSAGDPLAATLATTVSHGTLVLNSNGSFTYTPAAGFTGTDSFTYVPDGTYVAGSPTTVTITVTAGASAAPPPPPSTHHGGSSAAALPADPPSGDPPSSDPPSSDPPATGALFETASLTDPPTTSVTSTGSDTAPAPVSATDPTVKPVVPTLSVTSVTADLAIIPVESTPAVKSVAPTLATIPPVLPQVVVPTPSVIATTRPKPVVPITVPPLPQPIPSATPWVDVSGLMAVTNPILLPSYTVAGDETSSLLLPAKPEISTLPEAFSNALKRLTDIQPSSITFVDPSTGVPVSDDSPTTQTTTDPGWLLVDMDPDDPAFTQSSVIDWGSIPT
ncbi:MAG TPA: right-handed parallel beta-helix repeat-containing protein [Acetobacteraceae bacterium]|nr:right-handed parallel beta-helix repeat-containing protein [Acetobacteraceae bacterium]